MNFTLSSEFFNDFSDDFSDFLPRRHYCGGHRISGEPHDDRRLSTSSTARRSSGVKFRKVKTITQPPALTYSTPVTVQTTVATVEAEEK